MIWVHDQGPAEPSADGVPAKRATAWPLESSRDARLPGYRVGQKFPVTRLLFDLLSKNVFLNFFAPARNGVED